MITDEATMQISHWYGCYSDGWNPVEIVPAAFGHPAKYSKGLISRIYEHLLEKGYVKPGDTIADPFGGVALGARYAISNGLNWVGVELELKFQRIGQGMDCPGFDKAYYRRYNQRGRKWNELNICPDCGDLLNAKYPIHHFFGSLSRPIPEQRPHRYRGNIERWEGLGFPGTARLLQGDSRSLAAVLEGAGCVVGSPPYADSFNGRQYDSKSREQRELEAGKRLGGGQINDPRVYGETPGQLGNMKEGDISAVIGSPPYADLGNGVKSGTVDNTVWGDGRERKMGASHHKLGYGQTDGQLGAMKEGTPPAAIISSPPYSDAVAGVGEGPGARHDFTHHSGENATKKSSANGYGAAEGNLGNMPVGAVISSPPFEASLAGGSQKGGILGQQHNGENKTKGGAFAKSLLGDYGSTEGNIGNDTGNDFWSAAAIIVAQCYEVLRPGGVAAFVTGDFRRNGQIVPFGEQWLALCESVGFVGLERITAWKVEPGPIQTGMFGEDKDLTKERLSFFRRLDNKKNPGNEINCEEVWIVRKPL